MPQLIVGSLLLLIVITAGWLVAFYNKMTNKKMKVEECIDPEMIEGQINLYNQAVSEYNEYLRRFPNSAASLILGLQELSYYQKADDTRLK